MPSAGRGQEQGSDGGPPGPWGPSLTQHMTGTNTVSVQTFSVYFHVIIASLTIALFSVIITFFQVIVTFFTRTFFHVLITFLIITLFSVIITFFTITFCHIISNRGLCCEVGLILIVAF